MPSDILFFTGAPTPGSLNWDPEEINIIREFSEPFNRFLKAHIDHTQDSIALSTESSAGNPHWRSLPLERQHLATGISQDHDFYRPEYHGPTNFFTAESFIAESQSQRLLESHESMNSHESVEVLSQYYEHSYAIHEDMPSSQLSSFTTTSSSSFTTSEEFSSWEDSQPNPPQDIPISGYLTNIQDIPNAAYLSSIQPQTMTINLIVGLISVPSPRTITTRRGATVSLLELLVGDETRSSFTVNFWLPALSHQNSSLRTILEKLRPRDVVLMRNVALNSFKGKVYGQSLRKDVTKVWLLYRNKVDREDEGGCYRGRDLEGDGTEGGTGNGNVEKQLFKTRRVRDWVLRFLGTSGAGGGIGGGRDRNRGMEEVLPIDTQ